MTTMRKTGLAYIAGAALVALTPSVAVADNAQQVSGEATGNLVHRVSHALATTQTYSAGEAKSGYKWGQDLAEPAEKASAWAENREAQSVQNGSKWGSSKSSQQTRNPWGRANAAEQSRNPWGRANTAEQTRNPWGRANAAEQSRNPWGRA